MWSSSSAVAATRHGIPPEFFFVAPSSSTAAAASTINFDPNASNAIGVIPLLTATPCPVGGAAAADDGEWINTRNRCGGGGAIMQLWQNRENSSAIIDHTNNILRSGGSGGGATSCQDCGNQAKKGCSHRRCRTCCKSRGFDCSTHVKSTWIPAARRREQRHLATAGSSHSTSSSKKPRLGGGGSQTTTTASHTSTSNTTPPRSFDTSSSHQDASLKDSLPGEVRAPAVFKCVRVTPVDDGADEYAYQAAVRIGGHVFKGFLYDQGVVEARDGVPNISELHLGGGGGGRNGATSSVLPILDPSDIYSGGGFLGGCTYGNPMN